jgi:YgiT-type zinc finger domain-containing protein
MAKDAKGEDWEDRYQAASAELSAWHRAHPHATLSEIEAEMDKKLNRLRAQMLADLAGEAVLKEAEEMRCPECGERMHRRGKKKRRLQVQGGEEIELERDYAVCPNCGEGLFPPG